MASNSSGAPLNIAGNVIFISSTNGDNPAFAETGYASIAFLLIMAALVFLMTPGLGLFYSGLSRSKNAVTLIMMCFLSMSAITIQWVLFGFSLSFSESGSSIIGDFKHAGFQGLGANALALTAPAVPSIIFAAYQMKFATITPALIFGAVSERFRILPGLLFILIWATLVFCPVAYWTWAARGWLRNLSCLSTTSTTPCGIGSYDFAGGGPVHITSGFAGLAYAMILGKGKVPISSKAPLAHDMSNVFLGTGLLWFGWFAFNGGSALAATPRAAMAGAVTTIAAAAASMTWVCIDYYKRKKFSGIGFCSGVIAGLVLITPAAGYVAPWSAIVIGIIGGIVCNYSIELKNHSGLDDTLDTFSVHGVGGFVGNILTGIFAEKWVGMLDGTSINGGAIEGNWIQIAYQLCGSTVIAAYSFVISYIILYVINRIPGFHLRPTETDEFAGADKTQMAEILYVGIPSEKLSIVPSPTSAKLHAQIMLSDKLKESPAEEVSSKSENVNS